MRARVARGDVPSPDRCNGSRKQATRNPQQAVINFGPRQRGGYGDIANDVRWLATVLADTGGAALPGFAKPRGACPGGLSVIT
jgi:hypothetical protein